MIKSLSHQILLIAGLVLSFLPVTSRATDTIPLTTEERLARIESAIARIEARLNDTVSADERAPTLKEFSDLTRPLGWDGKSPLPAVKPAGKEKFLALGGFIQANYMSGNTPDSRVTGNFDTFLLRRARLSLLQDRDRLRE